MKKQDISKMGAARVSIETLDGVECVLKQDASEVEINFYQLAARALDEMKSPALLKLQGTDLFIEYIPNPTSLKQLRTNSSLFSQLASLHCSNYKPPFPVKLHKWTDNDTNEALRSLALPETLQSSVKNIQKQSAVIFDHSTLISGDTNEGNWGVRDNGELVLFDWERFGYGSPAIDLAPLVNELGSISEYEQIISEYTRHNSQLSDSHLLKQLIIAKCWIIIEVVNILSSRKHPDEQRYVKWYRSKIPEWLAKVEKAL